MVELLGCSKPFQLIEIALFLYGLGNNMFMPLYKQFLFDSICSKDYATTYEECRNNVTLNTDIQLLSSEYNLHTGLISIIPNILLPVSMGYIVGSNFLQPNKLYTLPLMAIIIQITVCISYISDIGFLTSTMVYIFSCIQLLSTSNIAKILVTLYISRVAVNKSFRFFLIESLLTTSEVIGSIAIAFAIKYLAYSRSFIICFVILCLGQISLIFIEDAPFQNEKEKDLTKFTWKDFTNAFQFKPGNKKIFLANILLCSAPFFISFAEYGVYEVLVNYLLLTKFSMSTVEIGLVLALTALFKALGAGIVVPLLLKYKVASQKVICILCFFCSLMYYILMMASQNRTTAFVAPIFMIFESSLSAINAHNISDRFKGVNEGLMFGICGVTSSIGISAGIFASELVFNITVKTFPASVFLLNGIALSLGSIFTGTSFVIAVANRKVSEPPDEGANIGMQSVDMA